MYIFTHKNTKALKKSEIKFSISLDEQNVPEKIHWNASDKQPQGEEETKAIAVALWDFKYQSTLKIDLWSKDMPVDEMKRFCIETIGGMADTLMKATGDQVMVDEINDLCNRLGKYLENETKKSK
jgi:gliding motility-associated protein GldC